MSVMRNINKKIAGLTIAVISCIGIFAVSEAAQQPSDSEIADAVDDQLIMDSATPASDIDVGVKDGLVELTGSVKHILAKDRAERLASILKGVRGVVNNITVNPGFRSDAEIEEAIEDALARDPVADPSEVRITVKNGVVYLSGTVASWEKTQLIAQLAKGVRGVIDLENNLENEFATDRSDSEIKSEILESIRWDAYLDGALITVNVDDGNVELDGVVGSAAEKDRAYRRGWVPGVKNLDMEGLKVERWARDEDLRQMKYNSITDEQIGQAVNEAFKRNPRLTPFKIEVNVDDGVVTLRGNVANLQARHLAEQYASGIVGVWRVRNRIKIRGESPGNRRIKTRIEDALAENPYLEPFEIDVVVDDGTVYLEGQVDSAFEKSEAGQMAAKQVGVRSVKNKIDIGLSNRMAIYSPYAAMPHDYIVERPEIMSKNAFDWEIKENIESELFWSPFVSSDAVKVEVDGSVATLSGSVGTWTEYNAAEENAYEGGAVDVDNKLYFEFGPTE